MSLRPKNHLGDAAKILGIEGRREKVDQVSLGVAVLQRQERGVLSAWQGSQQGFRLGFQRLEGRKVQPWREGDLFS